MVANRGAEHDDALLWSWERAFDENVILLGIDFDQGHVENGGLMWGHVTRHVLAWDDTVVITTVVGKGADLTVIARTVALWTNVVMISLDGASVTVALGGADDVNDFAGLEDRRVDGLSNVLGVDFVAL